MKKIFKNFLAPKLKLLVSMPLAMTLAATLVLTGCLEPEAGPVTATNVGTAPSDPADFVVVPAPPTPTTNPDPSPNPAPEIVIVLPPEETDINYDFVINGGSPHTSGLELHLAITAPVFVKSIKIGQKADCSDGAIESLKENVTRPVFQRNAINQVAMQFIDFDDMEVACIVKNIIQDDQAPEIIISKYPLATLEEGSRAELIYSVSDVSTISEVTCSLNSLVKSCTSGLSQILFTEMAAGNYVFKVEATDEHGYKSSQSVSWSVVNSTKKVTQVVEIKDSRKVDILIVIDNSGSMSYEQKSMANRVSNMLSILNGLDWQIAVTTTDPRNIALGDGRLIPMHGMGGQLILDSSVNINNAQVVLGKTLQRPEVGSGTEQSIYTTYRFIERSLGSNPEYRRFFRDGANFATLVISDEDESANGPKNDPQNLMRFISTTFNEQKVFTWHSIITKPGDKACKNTHGAVYGERLFRTSELTGGLVGSVCESDYAQQVMGITNGIRNMNKSFSLTCQSLEAFPIVIKKDGVDYLKPFVKEGLNLKFNDILEPGSYSIEYRCLN